MCIRDSCCSTGEINAKKAENPEELLKTAEEIFS
jgi:hypothetical protein